MNMMRAGMVSMLVLAGTTCRAETRIVDIAIAPGAEPKIISDCAFRWWQRVDNKQGQAAGFEYLLLCNSGRPNTDVYAYRFLLPQAAPYAISDARFTKTSEMHEYAVTIAAQKHIVARVMGRAIQDYNIPFRGPLNQDQAASPDNIVANFLRFVKQETASMAWKQEDGEWVIYKRIPTGEKVN